ncbi:MAG: hypothetical protein HOK52_14940 [Candidatus Marinimicrobia bacterium]|jgi:hypothetical protein|nr:hypothetical protein [Candidatus Neomarinimicrobiota bacterium]
MSKITDYIIDMEQDSLVLSYVEFVEKYGSHHNQQAYQEMRIPVLLLEGQDNLTVSQNGNKS